MRAKPGCALRVLAVLAVAVAIDAGSWAQQPAKPLTNQDVIKMVRGKVPESVVVAVIQKGPAAFDTSADALIRLHSAGVTEKELDAMLAASSSTPNGQAQPPESASGATPSPSPAAAAIPTAAAPTSPAESTTTANDSRNAMPVVDLQQEGQSQELPLEKTQLAQTKTEPESMSSLAGDSVLTQSIQAGVGTVSGYAASHVGSAVGGSTVAQAGSIFSGVMARRKPSITYVWAVLNPASTNVLHSVRPAFAVHFATTPGVNASNFAPAIVKLTPAQNTCRIIGATRGKTDASASFAADWQIYSNFLEERVEVHSQKKGTGEYVISPASPLLPGEYAVVLRPVSKSMKFAGGDVARGQGNGLMFDAVWSFQIAGDAH